MKVILVYIPHVNVGGHLFPINITSSSKYCFGQFNTILNSWVSLLPPPVGSNRTCPPKDGVRNQRYMRRRRAVREGLSDVFTVDLSSV